MNADEELELLDCVRHLSVSVDVLSIVLCILLGVIVALMLTGRK